MTKNAYFFIHHGDSSKQVLVVVYTNYELIPSIIRCHTCMQIAYPVFETLTLGGDLGLPGRDPCVLYRSPPKSSNQAGPRQISAFRPTRRKCFKHRVLRPDALHTRVTTNNARNELIIGVDHH